MHVNIADVEPVEIAEGVFERVLLKPEDSRPGGLGARHYVVQEGSTVTFEEPLTEFQHYIISGVGFYGANLVHGDTTIFAPAGTHSPASQKKGLRRHSISNAGEGELRIFTIAYKVPRPAFRWAKSRVRNLHQVPTPHQTRYGYTQIITEEEHAIMGALKMHAIDIQTHPGGYGRGKVDPKTGKKIGGRNPEEILYCLRGLGEFMGGLKGGEVSDAKPGSFGYVTEGALHGIWHSTSDVLQYICMEFIEHDKSWTERGYQGDVSPDDWK